MDVVHKIGSVGCATILGIIVLLIIIQAVKSGM